MTAMVTEVPDRGASSPDSPDTPRRPSLSPSRAADFKTCPLLYRFRTIDRLPERKSRAAVGGTRVHTVLEPVIHLPARQRTPPPPLRIAGTPPPRMTKPDGVPEMQQGPSHSRGPA